MKKICWVTFSGFLDTDIGIVPLLTRFYNISWFVISDKGLLDFTPVLEEGSECRTIVQCYRDRDIRNVYFWGKLCRMIRKEAPSIVYISGLSMPYFYPVVDCFFSKNRLIHAAHNVIPYEGWPHRRMMSFYVRYVLGNHDNIHVFSRFLVDYLEENYPGKNVLYAPMTLKDFGDCQNLPERDACVRFLFFGNVKSNKRLDLLIRAFKEMPLEYRQKSELTIAGKCEEKDLYLKLIEGEERIRVRFERIEDAEIPELFSLHDFLVLPYENVAQSGPHMIAYNYNVPVIASNIDGFKERIMDTEDGYLFEVNDELSLRTVLMKAIDHYGEYDQMVMRLKSMVKTHFANEVIVKEYKLYIDKIMKRNGEG